MRYLLAAVLALSTLAPASAPQGPRVVELTISHSRFVPSQIEARPGESLRIVVHNADFIDHELIVGDDEVHQRHESGTERFHAAVPGEVSVSAWSTAVTTWQVEGTVLYACHLPGHFAYGMQGLLSVSR